MRETPTPPQQGALLQQALEALELSGPFPGNEAKWSAAINAIYAAMADAPQLGAEPSEGNLSRAADFLEHYAAYINRVKPEDLECHPYLPELEQVAAEVRALAALPVTRPEAAASHPVDALLPEICQLLDTAREDFMQRGLWTEWDQSVRDRITAYNLSKIAAPQPSPTVTHHGVTMPSAVWERIKDGIPADYTEEEFRAYSAVQLAREQPSPDEMRAAFETWFSDKGESPHAIERDMSGSYRLMQAHHAWTAWQAAWSAARPSPDGVKEPIGWLYDWIHSSALGKPDEHFTGFTTDEAYARKHDNARPVYAANMSQSASREDYEAHKQGDGNGTA